MVNKFTTFALREVGSKGRRGRGREGGKEGKQERVRKEERKERSLVTKYCSVYFLRTKLITQRYDNYQNQKINLERNTMVPSFRPPFKSNVAVCFSIVIYKFPFLSGLR